MVSTIITMDMVIHQKERYARDVLNSVTPRMMGSVMYTMATTSST